MLSLLWCHGCHLHAQKNVYAVHPNLHWLFLYLRHCSFFITLTFFLSFSIFSEFSHRHDTHTKNVKKTSGRSCVLKAYRLNFVRVTISQSTQLGSFSSFLSFRSCRSHTFGLDGCYPFFPKSIHIRLIVCVVKNVIILSIERCVKKKKGEHDCDSCCCFFRFLIYLNMFVQWYVINMYAELACRVRWVHALGGGRHF